MIHPVSFMCLARQTNASKKIEKKSELENSKLPEICPYTRNTCVCSKIGTSKKPSHSNKYIVSIDDLSARL